MELDAHGREFYRITITTSPELTNWEASFDDGTTWVAGDVDSRPLGEAEPNTWEWLVAGAAASPTGAAAVIDRTTTPHVRAIDSPEVIVRRKTVPTIVYDQR